MKDFFSQIKDTIEKENFNGVISIESSNSYNYCNAFGLSDFSNNINNRINTKFGIASGTKSFVSAAICRLIDKELLTLDSKIKNLIDADLPNISEDVTIYQLLTHTSGIYDYYDEELCETDEFEMSIPTHKLKGPKDYLPMLISGEMKFKPGEKFSYCNSGYIILALIIETISKMLFKDFIKKEIFDVCDMQDSGFYYFNQFPENTANGYYKEDEEWFSNIYKLPIVGCGDGGAFSTALDISKFWKKLINGNLLSEKMRTKYLNKNIKTNDSNVYYGFGMWIYQEDGGKAVYFMEGCDAGVSFLSKYYPNGMIGTVISNTTDGAWPIYDKLDGILE